jgi:capsid assembly protease
MKGELLIAEFFSTPWALMPERIDAFAGVLRRWAKGGSPTQAVVVQVNGDRATRDGRKNSNARAGGGTIAVLPLYGVVTQRGNMIDDISGPGSVSTQQFSGSLRDALADDAIGSILIDIDSPGGSVYGVAELADEIYQARAKKPVVAIANSLAASAAYWIGSSAAELYVTPGGEVGSIGVYLAHEDWSKNVEEAGVKVTLISAGKYKVEGNPYEALPAEARAFMQSRVDDYYGAFTRGVARGRNVSVAAVRQGMGQGRVLGAGAALSEKMVDGVMTFDEVVKKMQRDAKAGRPGASRVGAARVQLAESELKALERHEPLRRSASRLKRAENELKILEV